MVSDVLGVESRTRRAEIDAVVLAAEESVPDDLLAGRIDTATALDRLRARGLDAGVAHFAIEVWRYALGMLAADAQPPSLTNSLEVTSQPTVTDQPPAFDSVQDSPEPQTVLPTFAPLPPPTVVTAPVPVTAPVAHDAGPPAPRRDPKQRWLLIAVPIVVVALIVGVVLATQGGDNDAAAATTTQLATTTSEAATTTTAVVAPTIFSPETTAAGPVTRTWSVENGQLTSTLVFDNTTTGDMAIKHYEVVPKSVAAKASLITADQPFTVIKDDPVIEFDLTVPANKSLTVQYTTGVPADATSADLEQWKAEQLTDAEAFTVERNTPPAVAFTTPDGAVVTGQFDADVGGTVDPTATLTVNGGAVTVSPDGTWLKHVEGMLQGANQITATATSRFGVVNQASITVNVAIPEPEPDPAVTTTTKPKKVTPTTTTVPGSPQPGPTTTIGGAPIPDAPTTTQAPALQASISGPSPVFTGCSNTYTLHLNFSPTSIDWSDGTLNDGKTSSGYQFNTAGTYTISAFVTSGDGRSITAAKTIQVQDNVIPPGQPGSCG